MLQQQSSSHNTQVPDESWHQPTRIGWNARECFPNYICCKSDCKVCIGMGESILPHRSRGLGYWAMRGFLSSLDPLTQPSLSPVAYFWTTEDKLLFTLDCKMAHGRELITPHIHTEVRLWLRLRELQQTGVAGGSLPDTLVFNKLLSAACLLSTKLQAGLSVLSPSARYVLSLHSFKEDVKLSRPIGFLLMGK